MDYPEKLPDPGELGDRFVSLSLRDISPAIPEKDWLPSYHFDIVGAETSTIVGFLNLRVGLTETIRLYAGHIGYGIDEAHRGQRYAARAVTVAAAFAHSLGVAPIWITCDPDNIASRRTCEIVGAEYIETVPLPPGNQMYQEGSRAKCRYRLSL